MTPTAADLARWGCVALPAPPLPVFCTAADHQTWFARVRPAGPYSIVERTGELSYSVEVGRLAVLMLTDRADGVV